MVARVIVVAKLSKLVGCCGKGGRTVYARSEAVKAIVIMLASEVLCLVMEMILYQFLDKAPVVKDILKPNAKPFS